MPKVAIGGIVRNRAWVLPDYLAALTVLEHDDKEYRFLENDSEDDTLAILDNFANVCGGYPFAFNGYENTGATGWDRNGVTSYRDNQFKNLAELRNRFVDFFLLTSDAEYLFSVDSDIIVPPDTLRKLLEHADQETIVGAAICNIPGGELDGRNPGNFLVELQPGLIHHPNPYPLQGTMDVHTIGAVYLIPRRVLENKAIRYGCDWQGEDVYFCRRAAEWKIKRKVVLDAKCEHRMQRT